MMGAELTTYWRSEISEVRGDKVWIRGYDLEELIGGLPFTASAFLLVRGRMPTPQESRVLDAVLNGVLDYSLRKPGTVAARHVVSANPSMVAGLAAATLAVGQHTLATEDAARFITESYEGYRASGLGMTDYAEQLVAKRAEARAHIPGFGHPVFKKVDPRAAELCRIAVEAGMWDEACRLYEEVHRVFTRPEKKADIPINDVGMMAALMVGLGFSPEESTGLATISTLPGVVAHISEELRSGTPIRVVPDEIATYEASIGRDFDRDRRSAGWPDH
ncbi:citryl-CoA lyase [Saccharopolyspora mangrovi]|uniref:citrate synthase (unknown stereospecificity) n=1 Tax=Saccharopolyspora mangrovi TaxID=3082379 RepID=A0ABU6AG66_9PSEU|nr:citryl-CoA lyase [Saccharopolyspora sp. S2-29]MEB3370534.1 citryl-CoA lyase [Saccharopolyspora sp. S2-29]